MTDPIRMRITAAAAGYNRLLLSVCRSLFFCEFLTSDNEKKTADRAMNAGIINRFCGRNLTSEISRASSASYEYIRLQQNPSAKLLYSNRAGGSGQRYFVNSAGIISRIRANDDAKEENVLEMNPEKLLLSPAFSKL